MLVASELGSDRNLLFGVLALQLDFVDQHALIAGMQAWLRDKSQGLADLLVQAGDLSPYRRELLESLVQEHLAQHRYDMHESLASLTALQRAEDLLRMADTDLRPPPDATVLPEPDPNLTIVAPAEHGACRYNVLRPLGKGGLGLVWVARDGELQREVALKEIQPRLAGDSESRVRFVREAEITGGLEHPGIVPVYGLGAYSDGRLFYAMRLINGESLRSAILRFHVETQEQDGAARAAGLRKLLRPFIDACNAVAYAHSRRVLHRDLKPDNIMLGRFGETLVVDWGLAKVWEQGGTQEQSAASGTPESETIVRAPHEVEGLLRLSANSTAADTQMGAMLGTPQFMSPEQAAGRLDLVSPASDIYSLGATLYGILTGQTPFAGLDLTETLQRVRRGEFLRPRQIRRDLPPPLEAICLKAMSLSPRERYATASELADELDHWLADEPVIAYAEPWRQRVGRWSRRHRAWTLAGAVALVFVALTASLAAAFVCRAWQNEAWALSETSHHLKREQREHNLAVQARREAEAARHATEQAQCELSRQITLLGLEEQLRRSVQSKPLLWEIAADRIEPLHERLRVPTAQDLSMQTWNAYRASRPERLEGRTTIYLLPVGSLSEVEQDLALDAAEFLSRFYSLPTRWLDPAPAQDLSEPSLIVRLISGIRPRDAVAVVGVTNLDLGTPGFCKDAAKAKGIVVSFARLGDPRSSDEARQQVLRRLLQVSVCAVGQAVGIRDFAAYHCGMNTARSLTELDEKPLAFCPECEQKVWWLSDAEPLERYKRLADFAAQHGLEHERLHWQRSLDAVRTPREQSP